MERSVRSGSSQFGSDNRYAPFWSVGAGCESAQRGVFAERVA